MSVIISKRIPHTHNGRPTVEGKCYWGAWDEAECPVGSHAHGWYGYLHVGTPCPVCGAILYKQRYYALQCKASNCATINVHYDSGILTPEVVLGSNDTGISDVSYKWYFEGKVVSDSAEHMPIQDGEYTLEITCTDKKTNQIVKANTTFYVEAAKRWETISVGDVPIYGMAVGDILCNSIAIGDLIIGRE